MWRWGLPAALMGVVAVVAAFPLAWIAPRLVPSDVKNITPDLNFRGTIWNGHVTGVPFFNAASFNVLPFTQRVDIQAGNGQNYAAGRLGRSNGENMRLRADISTFPIKDGRLQGLKGEVFANISEMTYSNVGCEAATGTARTDVLQRNGGAIQWTGPELTGPLKCEDGALIADLSGQDAQQQVSALIRLSPDGSYRADIVARTDRTEADVVLPLFGFSRSGRDFKLTEQGRWR